MTVGNRKNPSTERPKIIAKSLDKRSGLDTIRTGCLYTQKVHGELF
ncbi:MAG: hypothetical protein K0R50_1099 [Eubacterium sp.]|jgi:hypothetical protein|nr:hypothetical protein [Eubacterium sp.]